MPIAGPHGEFSPGWYCGTMAAPGAEHGDPPSSTFIGQPLFAAGFLPWGGKGRCRAVQDPWMAGHRSIAPGRSVFSYPMTEPASIMAMAAVGEADPAKSSSPAQTETSGPKRRISSRTDREPSPTRARAKGIAGPSRERGRTRRRPSRPSGGPSWRFDCFRDLLSDAGGRESEVNSAVSSTGTQASLSTRTKSPSPTKAHWRVILSAGADKGDVRHLRVRRNLAAPADLGVRCRCTP